MMMVLIKMRADKKNKYFKPLKYSDNDDGINKNENRLEKTHNNLKT